MEKRLHLRSAFTTKNNVTYDLTTFNEISIIIFRHKLIIGTKLEELMSCNNHERQLANINAMNIRIRTNKFPCFKNTSKKEATNFLNSFLASKKSFIKSLQMVN